MCVCVSVRLLLIFSFTSHVLGSVLGGGRRESLVKHGGGGRARAGKDRAGRGRAGQGRAGQGIIEHIKKTIIFLKRKKKINK